MSDTLLATDEAYRRTIYVPFALSVEPLAMRVRDRDVPVLDAALKSTIIKLYREQKAGGEPSIRRVDSRRGSYRYAGYLYSVATSPAEFLSILEQLRPALFLAQIIDAAIDETFPGGVGHRVVEVGPPISNLDSASDYLRYLSALVANKGQAPAWTGAFSQRPITARGVLGAILLVGAFALAHAWIQYRGNDGELADRLVAIEGEIENLRLTRVSDSEPVVVHVETPDVRLVTQAPRQVDPSAPRIVRVP